MSWDEKDWAYTWITGKQSRINLLFRKFNVEDITSNYSAKGHGGVSSLK